MSKYKLLFVVSLVVLMSGCLGGGLRTGKGTFTADATTFNFFTMKIDFGKNFGKFNANANPMDLAMNHVPKGGKITNVSACPTWEGVGFPLNIAALWNEYIFGFTTVQIGGTK